MIKYLSLHWYLWHVGMASLVESYSLLTSCQVMYSTALRECTRKYIYQNLMAVKWEKIKTVPSFFVDVSLERRNKNTISVFHLTLGQIEGFVTFVWGDRSSCYPPTPTHAKVGGIFPLFYFCFPPVLEFKIWVWSESLPSKRILAHGSGYSRHRCWHNN